MQSPEIKAVMVGCGSMSAAWLRAARQLPDLDVVGFVDLNEEAARRRRDEFEYPSARVGTDLGTVLDATTPDMVFDCTVPEAHTTTAVTALRRGCHVLGEKPLADSMEHARLAVRVARETGRIYAVIQNRRYDGRVRRLRAFVESGVLGRLTTVHSDFYIGAHFGGFRDRMEHVLLLDMAIHTFDMARFLTSADPVSVYCKEWNPEGSWYDHHASAIAVFQMTGGIVYTYRGSWCAEGLNTSWEAEWRLIGRRGTVTWDGLEAFRAQTVRDDAQPAFRLELEERTVPEVSMPEKVGGHLGLIREFIHSVRTGSVPETVCTDNIKSLAMVFGAIASAREGREVAIEW